jgi:hypothetical protein
MLQLEFHDNCLAIGQPINHRGPARRSRQSVRRCFCHRPPGSVEGIHGYVRGAKSLLRVIYGASICQSLPECHKKEQNEKFCGKNRIPIDRLEESQRSRRRRRPAIETVRKNNCAVIIGSMSNGKNGKAETPNRTRRMEILLNSSSLFLALPSARAITISKVERAR